MLEYYFSKGFTLLEWNTNSLAKLPNEVKDRIHAEETENSDKVMTCTNRIPSTSNTQNNLAVNKSFHYSYIRKEFNDKKDIIINIFSAYVEPLLKYINHPELLQEWKLNLDAAEYERNIYANLYKPSEENKLIVIIESCTGQHQWKIQFSGFLFSPLWNIPPII